MFADRGCSEVLEFKSVLSFGLVTSLEKKCHPCSLWRCHVSGPRCLQAVAAVTTRCGACWLVLAQLGYARYSLLGAPQINCSAELTES